jgi:hypothetical protein
MNKMISKTLRITIIIRQTKQTEKRLPIINKLVPSVVPVLDDRLTTFDVVTADALHLGDR